MTDMTAQKDELLPCPFCGESGVKCFNKFVGRPEMHWILCRTCHASPGDRQTEAEAIAAWNTRKTSAAPNNGMVEKLREALDAIAHPTAGLEWTLPWRVEPCDGKPTIKANRGGNLFRGYIATWKEADLIVAVVNALPDILAALQPQEAPTKGNYIHMTTNRDTLRAEIINTPETADFMAAVPIEATHQRERWGAAHDAGKTPFDWFWLIGYLAQKAADAAVLGDVEKAKHHTISTAAALANWHAALAGVDTNMRPGLSAEIQATAELRAKLDEATNLLKRAAQNIPEHYDNWHSDTFTFLASMEGRGGE